MTLAAQEEDVLADADLHSWVVPPSQQKHSNPPSNNTVSIKNERPSTIASLSDRFSRHHTRETHHAFGGKFILADRNFADTNDFVINKNNSVCCRILISKYVCNCAVRNGMLGKKKLRQTGRDNTFINTGVVVRH
jgi:hypothetical protein